MHFGAAAAAMTTAAAEEAVAKLYTADIMVLLAVTSNWHHTTHGWRKKRMCSVIYMHI